MSAKVYFRYRKRSWVPPSHKELCDFFVLLWVLSLNSMISLSTMNASQVLSFIQSSSFTQCFTLFWFNEYNSVKFQKQRDISMQSIWLYSYHLKSSDNIHALKFLPSSPPHLFFFPLVISLLWILKCNFSIKI